MGLGIHVGTLASCLLEADEESAGRCEQSFETINRLLAAHGLSVHNEAREVRDDSRAPLSSFPYSFIHYLRRAYVRRRADPEWMAAPLPDSIDPADDELLREEYEVTMTSHLVCHSDAEGFYVPLDFKDIIVDEDLPGAILGSTQQLMRELVQVAPALGVRLENGRLSDDEAARIDSLVEQDEGLYRELASWILLYERARVSVEQGTAILFA